jgi:branched-chain amino acid transport system ATP-binding protein
MRTPAPQPLLELAGISKSFGGITALSSISICIPQRSIVGVIGPNGAGKTTLFNVITGAFRADDGEVMLEGERITHWPSYRIARAGIVRTFQNIRLFAGMTVREHLLVAQRHSQAGLRRFLPVGLADPVACERAARALQFFGLEGCEHRLARSLPSGTQRKVEIARALTAQPRILLLDEPVAGMSHDEAAELRTLLLRLQRDGLTILLIEHDMPFVMSLCHQLYVLDFGSLIAEGEPAEIRANALVLDAYLGNEN